MTEPLKLVIVEDDRDSRELLTAMLRRKFPELQVDSAGNGREAMSIFDKELPDIVLTDINMPEMDGMELARKVRGLKPDTVIVVITADTGKALIERSIGAGFKIDYYIYKPVNYQLLFASLEEAVQRLRHPQQ